MRSAVMGTPREKVPGHWSSLAAHITASFSRSASGSRLRSTYSSTAAEVVANASIQVVSLCIMTSSGDDHLAVGSRIVKECPAFGGCSGPELAHLRRGAQQLIK